VTDAAADLMFILSTAAVEDLDETMALLALSLAPPPQLPPVVIRTLRSGREH
jgi:hypothetical protein